MAVLSQVQVPRCHLIDSTVVDISLHLFSDASEDGYGMCSYLRFVYACGTVVIVRCVQNESFPEDVKEVKRNKEVKKSCKLGNLRPVLVDGVLRVGGRLQKAVVLSWDEKHPMVLPKRHHVSQLIVRHYHESAAHSGREQTLCELRRMFWIIGGRGLVKKTIRSCIRCRRMNAKHLEQFMGSLPRARLEAYHSPFTFIGVDLFGPLTVKWGRGTAKRWGCLFTCLATRAVYLDATPSLET